MAVCNGGATVVNGIVTGTGASFSIGLETTARVKLTEDPGRIDVRILNDPEENPSLATACVNEVLSRFEVLSDYGAEVVTSSDIPVSRGLKSSSTSANAIVLAALKALGKGMDDIDVIKMGVDASLKAGVTITGAFDDSCATYMGKLVVADNIGRQILGDYRIEDDLSVLLHVPDLKIRKSDVQAGRAEGIESEIEKAIELVMDGNYLEALTLNGSVYSRAMGLDGSIADIAMEAGALGAGISGTGPATVIISESERIARIKEKLSSRSGNVLETRINHKQVRIL